MHHSVRAGLLIQFNVIPGQEPRFDRSVICK
jgi:hypothetical protein